VTVIRAARQVNQSAYRTAAKHHHHHHQVTVIPHNKYECVQPQINTINQYVIRLRHAFSYARPGHVIATATLLRYKGHTRRHYQEGSRGSVACAMAYVAAGHNANSLAVATLPAGQ